MVMARRLLTHLVLFLLVASFVLPPLFADDVLLDEEQALPFKHFFGQEPLVTGTELQVSGSNNSGSQQLFIFRLDNPDSSNYRSRVNKEFSLPSGPFTLNIPLTGLKTSGGQLLNQPYSEMILFSGGDNASLTLNNVRILTPQALPENTLALDFGHADSPLFPGFELVEKEDSRLKGKTLTRFRKSGDALVQDGIEGIDTLTIPWPNGQWLVSLWAQDQGEWEYLPHFLNREVTVEDTEIIHESRTRDQWIQQVYLAGTAKEAGIDGDLWQLVGKRRTGKISKVITVSDGLLSIHLKGDRAARYLSAVVVEPLTGQYAKSTEDKRREHFISQWPVAAPEYQRSEEVNILDISQQVKDESSTSYLAAGGTLLNLVFEINSPVDDPDPVIAVAPPRLPDQHKLNISTRYGHWRYERPQPNASSLVLDDSYLRADFASMRLSSRQPRRIHIQVNVPVNALPGDYWGSIQLFSNSELYIKDYRVKVLPVTLPRLDVPVGLYLEPAPYYQWFSSMNKRLAFATACDLSLLATMGFTTLAPALATPDDDQHRKEFINQLKQLKRFGFTYPVLAYAPLKRLAARGGDQKSGLALLNLKQSMEGLELPEVYWSIFDEPVPEKFNRIESLARLLHNPPLKFKTAGHLNSAHQQEIAQLADLQIMNHGFGVTGSKIREMKAQGKVWLYNMPEPRLAAGAYLWRSGAEGYIQWHGRMPTADPFDPTDGREGDVIYLYPWQGSCPATLNIHRRLLDLHEATLDYRWLSWLEVQSENNDGAKALLNEIQSSIDTDWKKASTINREKLIEFRRKIIEFSQRLKQPS